MSPDPLSAAKGMLAGVRQMLPNSTVAGAHTDPTRWRSVTILGDADSVSRQLDRLSKFQSALETRIEPAPGDRGVELSVRARPGVDGKQPVWDGEEPTTVIRSQLRQIKELVETGEVLIRDPQPEGQRSKTPTGAVVDKADAAAGQEGVL